MAGKIPQSFINELLARIDLVSVIDTRIPLKKKGKNYSACCPFHNEKTPSFSVNPDKQFYYCFGCGAGGNALTFIMEYEGQDFVAAIEDLAAQAGIEVPRENDEKETSNYQSLFSIMDKVSSYYQSVFRNKSISQKAIDYLKNRGLSGEIAKQYAIGYAPGNWQNLLHLSQDQKSLTDDLVETGMMIRKDNGRTYDRFRDRIMFPIRDRRGRVLGFGGRVIDQGEPKYLNSPETTLFHKGNELYGLYEMRKHLRDIDHIILVEGYMDVVALAQYGIYNSVATLGTAATPEHLNTIFRICSKIIFCFDGDKAGRSAALRAIHHALPLLKDTREVRVMFLPEGEDPDSAVRKNGAESFCQQIIHAPTLFDFLFEHLTSQVDLNTFEGPARLIHLAQPFIKLMSDPILCAIFQRKLSELTGLSENKIAEVAPTSVEIKQEIPQPNFAVIAKEKTSAKPPTKESSITQSAEDKKPFRRAISLLLQHPNNCLPGANLSWLKSVNDPGAQILFNLISLVEQNENINTAMLIENWRGQPEEAHLIKLANIALHITEENAPIEFREIIQRLEKRFLIEQWDQLIEKSKLQPLSESEKTQLKQLQKQMH